jgi:hypothetical protein
MRRWWTSFSTTMTLDRRRLGIFKAVQAAIVLRGGVYWAALGMVRVL